MTNVILFFNEGFPYIGLGFIKLIIRPECVPVKCRSPPKIVHGNAPKIVANYGAVLQVNCDPGYTLMSEFMQVTCLETGQWSQHLVSCEPVRCEDISKFAHGSVNYYQQVPNVHFVGTIATFSCNYGFQLKGPQNISCLESGIWSRDIPKCQRKCNTRMTLIVKPWSKSDPSPCPNRPPSRINVPQKRNKEGFGPRADTKITWATHHIAACSVTT